MGTVGGRKGGRKTEERMVGWREEGIEGVMDRWWMWRKLGEGKGREKRECRRGGRKDGRTEGENMAEQLDGLMAG